VEKKTTREPFSGELKLGEVTGGSPMGKKVFVHKREKKNATMRG